mgnify:CR=1 FL=1
MKLKKMTDDEVQDIVKDALSNATSFVESEISQDRIKSQRYFEGEVDIGEEEGRSKIVSTKADKILKALNAIQMETLGNHHDAYMNVEIKLKSISQKIQESNEIEIQRNQFSELSTAVYKLLKITKAETTVYYDHCPMFNNGKGADWLSKEVDIKNPYYGSMMLNCGKVIETIKQ